MEILISISMLIKMILENKTCNLISCRIYKIKSKHKSLLKSIVHFQNHIRQVNQKELLINLLTPLLTLTILPKYKIINQIKVISSQLLVILQLNKGIRIIMHLRNNHYKICQQQFLLIFN
jgi:hypothetical protein